MKTTSDVRVYTTDATLSPYYLTFPTAVVEAESFWLQQPLGVASPPTPEPTGPTELDTGAPGSDSGSTSGSGSSSSSGSDSGSGGLSTGAKAGIGVGVALAVIIAAVVVLFSWLRKRKAAKKDSSVEVTYVGDKTNPSGNPPPELEDTRNVNGYNSTTNNYAIEQGSADPTPAPAVDSHRELPATQRNVASAVPRSEELDGVQREQEQSPGTELDSTQRTELEGVQKMELEGTQRMELDGAQRMELESQERRQRHEPETGMSATVRDVPELMYSAEYYELEGSQNEPRSELESGAVPAPPGKSRLSELQQIEAEEERLKKRREELLTSQQKGE